MLHCVYFLFVGGNHHGGGGRGTRSNKPRPLAMIRRAESFHHSRSLGDFDHLTRDESPDPRGSPMSHGGGIRDSRSLHNPDLDHRSMMNANGDNNHNHPNKNRLHKSKSMEFLKAKLLSRKSSTKLSAAPPHSKLENAPKNSPFSRDHCLPQRLKSTFLEIF